MLKSPLPSTVGVMPLMPVQSWLRAVAALHRTREAHEATRVRFSSGFIIILMLIRRHGRRAAPGAAKRRSAPICHFIIPIARRADRSMCSFIIIFMRACRKYLSSAGIMR